MRALCRSARGGAQEALEAQGKYYKQGEGPPLEDLTDAWTLGRPTSFLAPRAPDTSGMRTRGEMCSSHRGSTSRAQPRKNEQICSPHQIHDDVEVACRLLSGIGARSPSGPLSNQDGWRQVGAPLHRSGGPGIAEECGKRIEQSWSGAGFANAGFAVARLGQPKRSGLPRIRGDLRSAQPDPPRRWR